MRAEYRHAVLEAVRGHPEIEHAAITGSQARPGRADAYSDLDLLLIARDRDAVRDVRAWLPHPEDILICAFHLEHYCSILLRGFDKIDLAIFSIDEAPGRWVVHSYRVLKGGGDFSAQLSTAAAHVRDHQAVHLNPDLSIDNVLLLLTTALSRVRRGEELSAHAFVARAGDMVIALERRQQGPEAGADLLDPRRRLEQSRPQLATVMQESLFAPPGRGIVSLARYVAERYGATAGGEHQEVLAYLLAQDDVFRRAPGREENGP